MCVWALVALGSFAHNLGVLSGTVVVVVVSVFGLHFNYYYYYYALGDASLGDMFAWWCYVRNWAVCDNIVCRGSDRGKLVYARRPAHMHIAFGTWGRRPRRRRQRSNDAKLYLHRVCSFC